jgi:hypothetical protein
MKFHSATFLLLSAAAKAADTNALPALVPAYGQIPPTFWEHYGTLVLAGGIALIVLGVLILWKIWQPRLAVVLPPEILARDALAKLLPQPETGELLSAVSHILRRYAAAVFALPPGEMTTADFCVALTASQKTGAELAVAISGFLRECDRQKFSSSPADAPFNAASRALELIARAEARRQQNISIPAAAASGDGRTPPR